MFDLAQISEVSDDVENWLCAVFLAAESEELIEIMRGEATFTHRPGFQTTQFPCERVWEGSYEALQRAVAREELAEREDAVPFLDRLFFIRTDEEGIDLPRSAHDLLTTDGPMDGRWYAIVADRPLDAWAHVRDHEAGPAGEASTCPECHARIAASSVDYVQAVAIARSEAQPAFS